MIRIMPIFITYYFVCFVFFTYMRLSFLLTLQNKTTELYFSKQINPVFLTHATSTSFISIPLGFSRSKRKKPFTCPTETLTMMPILPNMTLTFFPLPDMPYLYTYCFCEQCSTQGVPQKLVCNLRYTLAYCHTFLQHSGALILGAFSISTAPFFKRLEPRLHTKY